MISASLEVLRRSAGGLASLLPEESRVPWLELQNRLAAFGLFQDAGAELGLPPSRAFDLDDALQRARALDPGSRLWVLEGLGYLLGESDWLGREGWRSVPGPALIPLHTGMGLSFATRTVEEIGAGCPAPDSLQAFAGLCDAVSQPGCAGALLEALGLAARTLHPELIPELDRCLASHGDGLAGYFWHGVGRALYFVPTNVVPWGSPSGRALDKACSEPPHALGRRNALAGLGWAMTLVNLQNPEVVDVVLARHGHLLSGGDAFARGVTGAVLVWAHANGRDSVLEAFLRHPAGSGLWDRQVRQPCLEGLERLLPALRREGRFGELFRCEVPR